MMNVDEFVEKMKLAASVKSLYIKGCFGAPLNMKNKKRYSQNNKYNRRLARTSKIMTATEDTFGSDCCGIIKGVLWGWNANRNHIYGGATYKSNGVPDIGADGMIEACKDASTDFINIEPGMLVWMSGHVGIYVGNRQVIESSPSFQDGCQYTNLGNIGNKVGNWRNWSKCGHLPWVEYKSSPKTETPQISQNIENDEEYYTVVKDDTMSKIAAKYKTTLAKLKVLNPQIKNINLIYPGQKVRVK